MFKNKSMFKKRYSGHDSGINVLLVIDPLSVVWGWELWAIQDIQDIPLVVMQSLYKLRK